MKVIAFNGSPRKDGNTYCLINAVFDELQKHSVTTELVQLGGKPIHGCTSCFKCFENQNQRCSLTVDGLNDWIEKMAAADGIILGSPTYFSNVSTEIKALIDRAGMVTRANGDMLKRKAGAAVVSVRRAGANHVFSSINYFFTISQMIIPGANYWNVGIGREKGEVSQDEEGLNTMRILGENMAWLLNRL